MPAVKKQRTAASAPAPAPAPEVKADVAAPRRSAATAAPATKKTKPVARKVKVVQAAAPASAAPAKHKLVRDSFTMPEPDFALITVLKARAIDAKRPAKKSELLRAGLQLLAGLTPTQLKAALNALEPVKTGRPKKD